ncbi:MAG: hypothetical protein EKK61_03230 [Rickettsiales bacterium]|nr:MAG: hypothetical protein EKK61_03230 [Rickettsiales bacterium]
MSNKLIKEFNYSKDKFLNNLKSDNFIYCVHNNTKKSILKNAKLILRHYQNNDLNIKLLPIDIKLALNYAGLYDFAELNIDAWNKQVQSTHQSRGRCIVKAPRDRSGLTAKYFKELDSVIFIDDEAVNKYAYSPKNKRLDKTAKYLKVDESYKSLNHAEMKKQKSEITNDANETINLIRGLLLEL